MSVQRRLCLYVLPSMPKSGYRIDLISILPPCVLLRIGIITSPCKRSLQLQLVCFATKPLSETGSQRPCNTEGVRWIQRSWGGEALKQLQAQSGSEKFAAGFCMTEDKFP